MTVGGMPADVVHYVRVIVNDGQNLGRELAFRDKSSIPLSIPTLDKILLCISF